MTASEIVTRQTARSEVVSTAKPESRKTSSMRRLSPRTSAANASIPCARAIAARRSRSCVPIPWPCSASATAKATSAQFDAWRQVEAGKRHDFAMRFDDQGSAASRLRCSQPANSRRRERRQPEEPVIPAVDGQGLEKRHQRRRIVFAGAPQADGGAVAHDHVDCRHIVRHGAPEPADGFPVLQRAELLDSVANLVAVETKQRAGARLVTVAAS